MAVDTKAKRLSVLSNGGRYWKGMAVDADGSIDAPDRLHLACVYNGNALASGAAGIIAQSRFAYRFVFSRVHGRVN